VCLKLWKLSSNTLRPFPFLRSLARFAVLKNACLVHQVAEGLHRSQRPPAKPEAFTCGLLKAAFASEQSQLIATLACLFLLLDMQPPGCLIGPDRRNPAAPGHETPSEHYLLRCGGLSSTRYGGLRRTNRGGQDLSPYALVCISLISCESGCCGTQNPDRG